MRSQLDGHDPRLPGTGVFDIKTRAALPLRYDVLNYKVHCTLSTIVRLVGCVRLLLTYVSLLSFFFFHSRLLRWTPDSTPCALFLSFSFVLFIIVCCHVPLVLGPFTHTFFPLPNSPLSPLVRPPPPSSVTPLPYTFHTHLGTYRVPHPQDTWRTLVLRTRILRPRSGRIPKVLIPNAYR